LYNNINKNHLAIPALTHTHTHTHTQATFFPRSYARHHCYTVGPSGVDDDENPGAYMSDIQKVTEKKLVLKEGCSGVAGCRWTKKTLTTD